MHKIRDNYSSCTGKISENICSSSGSAREKGKRVFCRFLFHQALEQTQSSGAVFSWLYGIL